MEQMDMLPTWQADNRVRGHFPVKLKVTESFSFFEYIYRKWRRVCYNDK